MRHGGKAPAKMIRIGPPSPVPNHRAANGTQAIGAMKRRASNTGVTISSRVRDQPIRRPRGMPTAAPRRKPQPNRKKLDARCRGKVAPAKGVVRRSKKRAASS